jgi:hypothetical protein
MRPSQCERGQSRDRRHSLASFQAGPEEIAKAWLIAEAAEEVSQPDTRLAVCNLRAVRAVAVTALCGLTLDEARFGSPESSAMRETAFLRVVASVP